MRIVGGEWGGRKLRTPTGHLTRPTSDRVREAWMSAIGGELADATVIDLFAGSGALGLEALSRGARHATFVERAPRAINVLKANLAGLRAEPGQYQVVQAEAIRFVERLGPGAYDLALADPPYRQGHATRLADLLAERGFARLLCVEHAPDEPVDGSIVWNRRYGDTVLTFLRSGDD